MGTCRLVVVNMQWYAGLWSRKNESPAPTPAPAPGKKTAPAPAPTYKQTDRSKIILNQFMTYLYNKKYDLVKCRKNPDQEKLRLWKVENRKTLLRLQQRQKVQYINVIIIYLSLFFFFSSFSLTLCSCYVWSRSRRFFHRLRLQQKTPGSGSTCSGSTALQNIVMLMKSLIVQI